MPHPHKSGQTHNDFNQQRVAEVALSDFWGYVIKLRAVSSRSLRSHSLHAGSHMYRPPEGALVNSRGRVQPSSHPSPGTRHMNEEGSRWFQLPQKFESFQLINWSSKQRKDKPFTQPCPNSQPRGSVSIIRWWWFYSLSFGVICYVALYKTISVLRSACLTQAGDISLTPNLITSVTSVIDKSGLGLQISLKPL